MGTPTTSDERHEAALRAGGHRVTSQRLVLYRVLGELGRHAHADEIARASSERLPGLSLPTVYATLEELEGRVDRGEREAGKPFGGCARDLLRVGVAPELAQHAVEHEALARDAMAAGAERRLEARVGSGRHAHAH